MIGTQTYPMQNLGAGDVRANALEVFSGMVLATWQNATKFLPLGLQHPVTEGKSHLFDFVGPMTADEHTAGTDLPGTGEPISEERTVPIDDKEIVAHGWINKPESQISHYDLEVLAAPEAAGALARTIDSRIARMICMGARQDARGDNDEFPAGNLVQRSTADTVAGSYPLTTQGSFRLQDDLAAMAQLAREKNVPDTNPWYAFLSPYLCRVLLKDKTITKEQSQDPTNPNMMLRGSVALVENFVIVQTNQNPSTNVTTGESAYQGNFTYVAVPVLFDQTGFGHCYFNGIDAFGPLWYPEKRASLFGAAYFSGIKWLRPEACGEIYCKTSAYTLSNGVYGP